jgi:predicted heme/steroid binding protein
MKRAVSSDELENLTKHIEEVFKTLISKDIETRVYVDRDHVSAAYRVCVGFIYKVSMSEVARNGTSKAFLEKTTNVVEQMSNNIKELEK